MVTGFKSSAYTLQKQHYGNKTRLQSLALKETFFPQLLAIMFVDARCCKITTSPKLPQELLIFEIVFW